jgi:hypothetical protein
MQDAEALDEIADRAPQKKKLASPAVRTREQITIGVGSFSFCS